jgi:hypothetical protein
MADSDERRADGSSRKRAYNGRPRQGGRNQYCSKDGYGRLEKAVQQRSDWNISNALTIRNGIHAPASRQKVGSKDPDIDRQRNSARPPTNDVTDQINLLLVVVVRPEADTTEKEWPVDGIAGIWMRTGQSCIVLKHEKLEFGEFLEEVHLPGHFYGLLLFLAIIFRGWNMVSSEHKDRLGNNGSLPSVMISSTYQMAVFSTGFLLPLISCCLNAQSGSGSGCVHIDTFVGTWTRRMCPDFVFHASLGPPLIRVTWKRVSLCLLWSSLGQVVNSWFVAIKGDATSWVRR